MISYWIDSDQISDSIFIPKYYNPNLVEKINDLRPTHNCMSIKELSENGIIQFYTGHEIGKNAYGTGDIPFVRTSDISNWEIKTIPKQGVSKEIYNEYSKVQDVQEGDILFVRDGTYLIGNNCFITKVDKELLFQSHILKVRVIKPEYMEPELLFLLFNTDLVQEQIRSFQFTADIIDTIGQRFNEIILPVPKDKTFRSQIVTKLQHALSQRVIGKAFIKHMPKIIEQVLLDDDINEIRKLEKMDIDEITSLITTETITSEFGGFNCFSLLSSQIKDSIFIPKYYDPTIEKELSELEHNCELVTMGQLKLTGVISYYTGDEIGKMAYGTGSIPFIRTSDFSNWEIKHNPKQGISEEIYEEYAIREDVNENDVLLVRDGTYLVGSSCIITKFDAKSLFCGGLYKIRCNDWERIDPFLLLGLLNSYIVKRQIRTKQFTRDVIDTIGNRIDEVVIPIPRNDVTKKKISDFIKKIVETRIDSREEITSLAKFVIN
ncbi:hypothetical protein [Paenibacillus sp. BC26]|uniref:hypothetical protein n=1 Tax=Paenibacillus sp. BC26 TaxID=1881032 RepID=UPI0008E5A64F|nr:hypothetical protein [Paenibacillus sp. BC26]SFT19211.1 hypothetical protein SAMN05428962_5011 [Paenibacillus sp. BC26]